MKEHDIDQGGGGMEDGSRRCFVAGGLKALAVGAFVLSGLAEALSACAGSKVRYSKRDFGTGDDYRRRFPEMVGYSASSEGDIGALLFAPGEYAPGPGWERLREGADLEAIMAEMRRTARAGGKARPYWQQIRINPVFHFYTGANVKQLAYYARLNGDKLEGIHAHDFAGGGGSGGGDAGGGAGGPGPGR